MTPTVILAALIVAGVVVLWLCSLISRGLTGALYHLAAWAVAWADARVYRMGRSEDCRRWADSMTPRPMIDLVQLDAPVTETGKRLPAPAPPPAGAGPFSRLARWLAQGEV